MTRQHEGREHRAGHSRPITEIANNDADISTPVRRAATDNPGLAAASAADRHWEVKE